MIGRIMGRLVGDVVITRDEIDGLMADLLVSHDAPTCPTRFSEWLATNAESLGRVYANELKRHFR